MPPTAAGDATETAPKVALFCPVFLPFSQTFIYDEIRSHTRYRVEAFAWFRQNVDRFPFEPVHLPRGLARTAWYGATTRCGDFDRALASGGFRLVHAHFGTSAIHAHPFHRRHRLPLVVTFHGYDVGVLMGRGRLRPTRWRYWARSRAILRDAALLLCASEELRDVIATLSGRPDATRLYRLGIDLQRFHRSPEVRDVPAVAMVGRFMEKKGFDDGIRAVARVLGRGHPCHLTIVGAGPLDARYRTLVADLGIAAHVTFAGVLPPPGVAAVLARTDVLIAPSRTTASQDRESGLLVLKEASASRAAVIGTRHGGIPEIIEDGETGYLVPERDIDALADRLAQLVGEPSLRTAMGEAGRRKMEREYDLVARVAALERLYDEVG